MSKERKSRRKLGLEQVVSAYQNKKHTKIGVIEVFLYKPREGQLPLQRSAALTCYVYLTR